MHGHLYESASKLNKLSFEGCHQLRERYSSSLSPLFTCFFVLHPRFSPFTCRLGTTPDEYDFFASFGRCKLCRAGPSRTFGCEACHQRDIQFDLHFGSDTIQRLLNTCVLFFEIIEFCPVVKIGVHFRCDWHIYHHLS